ncbi:MAG: glutamate racemase [Leuconostoc fallax]
MIKNKPIGMVDSGIGGLTVVKESLEKLPNEQIIYIGDTARMPYGPRTPEEVIAFTKQMADFLIATKDIKLLVIACNTATASALIPLQEMLPIPVIGVINSGASRAVQATHNQKIGIIATEGTIASQIYTHKIRALNQQIEVFSQAEPDFVKLVEDNQYRLPVAQHQVKAHLQPLKQANIDTLILGCTHFPLLRPFIVEAFGELDVTLIDAGAVTVDTVDDYLKAHDLSAQKRTRPHHTYYTTGDVQQFDRIASQWLDNQDPLDVRHLKITQNHLEEA